MQIVDILSPERILCDVKATSKKRVLEYFSKLLATETHGINNRDIYESLINRERLGSTSIGHGVAIPHARVSQCNVTLGAFLQLETGVNYDAIDHQPVDLLFALLVPEDCTQEHLDLLAKLAELFSDAELRKQLRDTIRCEDKFHLLTNFE
jgi:PTS system nitrogen regulatory IIA component